MSANRVMSIMQDVAVFVTVVETGSFTSAAQKLGSTPSAVSRQVSRLEDALKVRLLERSTRSLRLNATGEKVFAHCKSVLDSAQDVLDIADEAHGEPHGRLKIGVPKAYCAQVLRHAVPPFLNRYPDVEVQLVVTDRTLDPHYDDVDAVVTITDTPIEGLVAAKLGVVKAVLCASPTYIARNGKPRHPSELAHFDCLSLGETVTDNIWTFHRGDETVTVETNGRYIVNHTEIRMDAVCNHFGIGIFPDFTVNTQLRKGTVVTVLDDWAIEGRYQGRVNLQYPRSRHVSPKLRAFVDFASNFLDGDLQGSGYGYGG
ncbi:LysR family transcriptional regulator [Marinobacter halodurans]|uniref:LysR family transcriptional regulator n=1 Tax=Marinobacter halodurans TaxID=2528979 RepID=A0ABY1ZP12_9GAMM|nr:LysR family transcriptional regulator [Marinobacter halodurans]TBW58439.1 LysR family transcriptional regulator [Marinobacter halodurans]